TRTDLTTAVAASPCEGVRVARSATATGLQIALCVACFFAHKDSHDGKRRCDRVVCSGAIRSTAVELVALAYRRLARGNVDSRWAGGHARRGLGRSVDSSRDARIERRPSRCERYVLFGRCGNRCAAFRLRDRSIWPQEIVLYHRCRLSGRNGSIGFLVEFLELRTVSGNHRGGYWWRICGNQFGD